MLLNNEVTLSVDNQDVQLSEINIVTIDNSLRKIVLVRFAPFLKPVLLWRGEDYDSIGDYTQADIENKVLEILGDDQQATLQSLVI